MAKKKQRYTFTGDLLVPGQVSTIATSLDAALKQVERGDFEVENMIQQHMGFTWNGDDDTVQVEDIK